MARVARPKSKPVKNFNDVLFFLRAKVSPGTKLDRTLAKHAALDGVWVVSRDETLVLHGHWKSWSDSSFDEGDTLALVKAIAAIASEGTAAIELEGGEDGPYFRAFSFKGGQLVRENLVPDPYNPTEAQLARFDSWWTEDPQKTIRRGPPGKAKRPRGS
jgi:hypothetical protein